MNIVNGRESRGGEKAGKKALTMGMVSDQAVILPEEFRLRFTSNLIFENGGASPF